MKEAPYKVYVVVDRAFGDRLHELRTSIPVWIVDTPLNRAAALRRSKEHSEETHLTGVTIFRDSEAMSPEELLLSEVETIDLHHGSYSSNPSYEVVEVLGTPLTERIKAVLSEYGLTQFRSNASGFSALRPAPESLGT